LNVRWNGIQKPGGALAVTTDGFPLATTLRGFPDKIAATYGKAKGMWVTDRGIPAEMRDPARKLYYLVGAPKSKIKQHEKRWLDLP